MITGRRTFAAVVGLAVLFLAFGTNAATQTIVPYPIAGDPPVIDGTSSPGEWPPVPQISLVDTGLVSYVIPTYVVFAATETTLYVLVDAPGDQTVSFCDECLLAFDSDATAPYASVEIASGSATHSAQILGGVAAMGYGTSYFDAANNHRIYEFQMSFASLGLTPGGSIYFASPIDPFAPKACVAEASMPYDGGTGHDNAWPLGLVIADRGTWGVISLQQEAAGVPALGRTGLFGLAIALAAFAAMILYRRVA